MDTQQYVDERHAPLYNFRRMAVSPADGSASSTPLHLGTYQRHPLFIQRILARPYTVISSVVLVAMGIVAVTRRNSEWDDVYVGSARLLLRGVDLYAELKSYTYPPFSAWVFIPFTPLPFRIARAIWYLIVAASLVILIKTSWRLANGPRLEGDLKHPPASWREQIAFWIGHACALQLSLNAVTHLQTDLPIAALLVVGCAAIARRRYFRAATWIGVAAAFKATPLLFAPYLLWRRQWRAAGWLVALAIGVSLLPDTIHHPPAGGTWLGEWNRLYLAPMARPTYIPGDWKNLLDNNQALAGAASRWLTSSWREDSENLRSVDRPGRASTAVIRATLAALYLAVLLPVAIAPWLRWRSARTHRPARLEQTELLPDARMIECGIVLLLMVLLSPNSSRAHFCVLYLPAFCVARIAMRNDASTLLRAMLGLAVASATLSIHIRFSFTKEFEQILLWLGVVMFAAIFLLLASCTALIITGIPQTVSAGDISLRRDDEN